jgi:cytochrome c-type biogenesis protein CcmE
MELTFLIGRGSKPEMSLRLKLTAGALVVIVAIGYLAFLGAADSWQYYLSVDETVADAANLAGKRIRVSGRVAADSLMISDRRREAKFDLVSPQHRLQAVCRCPIPDNLAEGIEVVVEGELQPDGILGHKVITRCASKYESKEALAARDDLPSQSAYR